MRWLLQIVPELQNTTRRNYKLILQKLLFNICFMNTQPVLYDGLYSLISHLVGRDKIYKHSLKH